MLSVRQAALLSRALSHRHLPHSSPRPRALSALCPRALVNSPPCPRAGLVFHPTWRNCSSQADQTKQETKHESTTKKAPVAEIQSMPPALVSLVTSVPPSLAWPSLANISMLALKCGQAGVGLEQVEAYLVRQFGGQVSSQSAAPPPCFPSKLLLEAWLREPADKTLAEFIDYFRSILRVELEERKVAGRRAEYCVALWRMAVVLDHCVVTDNTGELLKLERFACRLVDEDPTLAVMVAMGRLGGQQGWTQAAPSLLPLLLEEVTSVRETSAGCRVPLPRLLLHTALPVVVDKLIQNQEGLSEVTAVRLHLAKCRAAWQQCNFSQALEGLSSATSSFLQVSTSAQEEEDKEQELLSLCMPLVTAWHTCATVAAQQKLLPALDYMVALAEVTGKREGSGLGLLPSYCLWLAVRREKGWAELAGRLGARIPESVRGEKFERTFHVHGMTQATRELFVRDYVKQQLLKRQVVTQPEPEEPETSQEEAGGPPLSEEVRQGLLEIAALQLVQRGRVGELVALLQGECEGGLFPPLPAVEGAAGLLESRGDSGSLSLLLNCIPPGTAQGGVLYSARCRLQLGHISSQWRTGGAAQLAALQALLAVYRAVRTDQPSTRDQLLVACVKHFRAFTELAALQADTEILDAVREGGVRTALDHSDPFLLLLLWEAAFFAPQPAEQERADRLLEELPWLLPCLDPDLVLARCRRYDKTSYYRRLLEATLKSTEKSGSMEVLRSRVFEELLAHQVRGLDLRAASETVKIGGELGVTITEEFIQEYLDLKAEVEASFSQSPVSATVGWLRGWFSEQSSRK